MEWSIVAGRPVISSSSSSWSWPSSSANTRRAKNLGVRDLAAQAQVNPTPCSALAELETRGLLETQRTAGRTVTGDVEKIAQTRRALAQTLVHHFIIRRQRSASRRPKSPRCSNRRHNHGGYLHRESSSKKNYGGRVAARQ